MNAKKRSFLSRVYEALPELHPAERRLGEFICDFPGEMASYSATELAALAHVSKATVSRFVKRVGYTSYQDARRHVRAEKQTGSRLFLTTSTDVTGTQSIAAHIAQGTENLDSTFLRISENHINEVAKTMLEARKVWVIGFRSSHAFASYLQWQMTQVLENIVAIPDGGQTLGEHLVSISDQDIVIVFGLRRRVAGMDQLLKYLDKTKSKLLYISDESTPFLASATWHFQCQTLAPGPLFNHVSVIAVCHLLATRAIELAGVAGRNRLRSIETIHEHLGEL